MEQPEVTITNVEVTPEQKVGVPNGTVLASGETVVYDYVDGVFTGWHKEVATNG